jgi:hypothetical protein
MNSNGRFLISALLGTLTVLATVQPAVGEERARFEATMSYQPLLSRTAEAIATPFESTLGSLRLQGSESTRLLASDLESVQPDIMAHQWLRSWEVFRPEATSSSIDLLRRTHSTERGQRLTRVSTGMGDVFLRDYVGRARMNGSGLREPRTVYLKFSMAF